MTREEARNILKNKSCVDCAAMCAYPLENPEGYCEYADAIRMAIKELKQSEQKWISCSERPPEDGTEVFVYLFERKDPYIAWVEDCRWYTEDFEVEKENYPIAWMPLPEPYREDKK